MASSRHSAASLQVSFLALWVCRNDHMGGTDSAGGPVAISFLSSVVVVIIVVVVDSSDLVVVVDVVVVVVDVVGSVVVVGVVLISFVEMTSKAEDFFKSGELKASSPKSPRP